MFVLQHHTEKFQRSSLIGHYELFNETSDTWIDLSQPLSSYESSSTKVETLEFRMRHQELVVLTNTDRYVYLVDKSATTNTIVNTVRLEEGFNSPDVHCLFTMSGERLKGEELAWTLLKEFSIRVRMPDVLSAKYFF